MEIIDRLKKECPDAGYTLDYDHARKLLVSVCLAAQCTDARVNMMIEDLYAKYPDVGTLAKVDVEDIERVAKPRGLGHNKARDIGACMKILKEQYRDRMPDGFDALLKPPGVGRESANPIVGDVFGKPTIAADTYCIRLASRMGLVDGIKEPEGVKMALWGPVPSEEGNGFCHRLVFHGRDACTVRTKPHCEPCCLNDICKRTGAEQMFAGVE